MQISRLFFKVQAVFSLLRKKKMKSHFLSLFSQMALDNSSPIKFKVQALLYPALQALDFNTPSYQQNGHIPILHRPLMVRFWLEYLNGDPRLVTSLLANNHTTPSPSQEIAAAKAKTDWTRLLPVAFQKNYKPVVPLHGDSKLLEKLPGLLDVRAAPLLADTKVLKAVRPLTSWPVSMTCWETTDSCTPRDWKRLEWTSLLITLKMVSMDASVSLLDHFGFLLGFRSF